VSEPKTLLLTETGVEWLPDGSSAVNVGPIVRALKFLTEGRGDDRGTDEAGNPLPDLMSLAFDVVESIILGGRKADYFRRVKRELEAQGDGAGRSSLSLATQAKRVQTPAQATALDHAADTLQALLGELSSRSLDEAAMHEVTQALEAFRAFGADRWLSATGQLLIATNALGLAPGPEPKPSRAKAKKRRKAPSAAPRKAARPVSPAASGARKKSKKRPAKRR
jgi:hypothetical protein